MRNTTSTILCLLLLLGTLANAQTQSVKKPNVIIIYADDLGWTQLSSYGNRKVQTPNIDALATQGIRFTQAYATAPICSPSRAGLLTGRYQQRFGAEFLVPELHPTALTDPELKEKVARDIIERRSFAEPNIDNAAYNRLQKGIPTSDLLLPQLFKNSGYVTGAIGKWHVGEAEGLQPWKRGFDYYYGMLTWGSIYASVDNPNILTKAFHFHTNLAKTTEREGSIQIVRNGEVVEETEYITDRLGQEAVGFIDKHKQEPFFLYVPFNAPHDPFQAKKSDFDAITTSSDTTERIYLAMLKSLDDAVGKIVSKLEKEGLSDNTLIFFGSDNGAASYTGVMSNAPLKGGTLSDFEGGIRVPMILKYPRIINKRRTYDLPVSNLDMFVTAASVANLHLPSNKKYDGVNLLPYVTGKNKTRPHEELGWRSGYSKAYRKGDWKLYVNERNGKTLLYNLAEDLGEKNDQSINKPDKLNELQNALKRWESSLVQPLWPFVRSEPLLELEDASYYFPI